MIVPDNWIPYFRHTENISKAKTGGTSQTNPRCMANLHNDGASEGKSCDCAGEAQIPSHGGLSVTDHMDRSPRDEIFQYALGEQSQ
jgi:hypothetical protein